ncbi:hypothetical protein A33O_16899 [Nitratireductor aquibiodomus RA22]|uniref:Uncharacterized protein n=1 Tax=Nitratireductor aquibiodomus RA22 TaxID=1189611 RepID=I5BUA8_9HYPH|nr:hypothetical protein A33O_16899 [Nitratireductor aquibiodomus RA22]
MPARCATSLIFIASLPLSAMMLRATSRMRSTRSRARFCVGVLRAAMAPGVSVSVMPDPFYECFSYFY